MSSLLSQEQVQFQKTFITALTARTNLWPLHTTFRLYDGVGDGISGVYIDRIGEIVLVHLFAGSLEPHSVRVVLACTDVWKHHGITAVYLRNHAFDARQTADGGAELIWGTDQSEFIISEGGIEYSIKPQSSTNAGLFLDMREIREKIRSRSSGKRVMNLFCYTGSLGLAAFVGGAREVVQVDSSAAMISWAKTNYTLNQQRGQGIVRFIKEDAREFLRREVRRSERGSEPYDLILIDPPSFSRGKGKTFNVERELSSLAEEARAVLSTKGELMLSTNKISISADAVENIVHEIGPKAFQRIEQIRAPREDFRSETYEAPTMRGVWCYC